MLYPLSYWGVDRVGLSPFRLFLPRVCGEGTKVCGMVLAIVMEASIMETLACRDVRRNPRGNSLNLTLPWHFLCLRSPRCKGSLP